MYNFLPTSYTELGRTPTQAEVEGALKDFQFMAALPESGLLDEQTAQIISTRRCDITDDVDRVRSRTTNPNHSLGKRNLVYEWAELEFVGTFPLLIQHVFTKGTNDRRASCRVVTKNCMDMNDDSMTRMT